MSHRLLIASLVLAVTTLGCVEEHNLQLYVADCYRDAQCPDGASCRDGTCVASDASRDADAGTDTDDTDDAGPSIDHDVLGSFLPPANAVETLPPGRLPWRRPAPTP